MNNLTAKKKLKQVKSGVFWAYTDGYNYSTKIKTAVREPSVVLFKKLWSSAT